MTARLLVLLTALLLAFGAACDPPADTVEQSELYTCSMHPQVLQSEPGTCPICGMDLVPVTAMAAGEIVLDQGVVQNAGVRTEVVQRKPLFRHVRTVGEVEVGEDQVTVVNLRYSGWAERVHVDKTGDEVRAGQVLFDIYSPQLVAAQEEFLLALQRDGEGGAMAASARRRLELWDIADRDIRRLEERGEASKTLPVRAPASGFVLAKNVVEGASVAEGQDLYRIGNLDKIWVTAEVYEFDAPWVEVGQPAQMELAFLRGQVLLGEVSYIYPTLNPHSRTLTVRLEFENPGVRLKPGMFATVYIEYRRKEGVLAVPSQAILHSGTRELVFVALGEGRFDAREISTGLAGDRHLTEVLDGLSEGDEVVVSGQFLLDSESQLQEALQKLRATGGAAADTPSDSVWSCPMHPDEVSAGPGRCSQCGMDLVERPGTAEELSAVRRHDHAAGYWTCPMHPEVHAHEPGRCPECGMFLEQAPGEVESP